MGEGGCCPKQAGLKKGAWTSQEDKILSDYIKTHGLGRWRNLPANAGLNRCGKSCRLRWLNYLRPDIKRGNITDEEEELIVRLHKLLGNRWSLIAGRLPGRTDNEIKNYWNTHLRRKVTGENSEKQPSSRTKKASAADQDPSTEKKEKSATDVIRTKAVRCARSVLSDQIPNSAANNESNAPQFLSDFKQQMSKDDIWIAEIMHNSLFPHVSGDSSYSSTKSSQNIGYAEISFNEEKYTRGLFSSGNKDGEGLYSFLDPDSWDALVAHQKS